MKLIDIVHVVEGTLLQGKEDIVIEGACGLAEASPTDISFLANMRYQKQLYSTKAAAVLIRPDTPLDKPILPALIQVSQPEKAFASLLMLIVKEQTAIRSGVDSSAQVSSTALLEDGVYVGPYAVIEDGARVGRSSQIGAGSYIGKQCAIGENCFFHPHITILDRITIGKRAIIHSGCVIGSDGYGFSTTSGIHQKIPQIGTVIVGDDVEIGANCAIDRATTGSTVIGSGTKIDNLVHIAHNVKIGEHCLIVAQAGISGSVTVGKQVTIAGQAGIVGHITIGDNAIIAAQAGVIGNVPARTVVSGYPARPHREAMKILGILQKLPELYRKSLKKKK